MKRTLAALALAGALAGCVVAPYGGGWHGGGWHHGWHGGGYR